MNGRVDQDVNRPKRGNGGFDDGIASQDTVPIRYRSAATASNRLDYRMSVLSILLATIIIMENDSNHNKRLGTVPKSPYLAPIAFIIHEN